MKVLDKDGLSRVLDNLKTYILSLIPSGGITKWYNLKLEGKGWQQVGGHNKDHRLASLKTIVENYDSALLDNTTYRFVLMRWRKKGWRAAMLSRSRNNAIADDHLDYWSVSGRESYWMGVNEIEHTFYEFPLSVRYIAAAQRYRFKNTNSSVMRIGCAIFKNTGEGTHGWQRCSNIAYVELKVKKNGSWSFTVKQE